MLPSIVLRLEIAPVCPCTALVVNLALQFSDNLPHPVILLQTHANSLRHLLLTLPILTRPSGFHFTAKAERFTQKGVCRARDLAMFDCCPDYCVPLLSSRFGYIEFYDPSAVVGALAMQGYELMGHAVMVKVSEAEKNVVNTTVTNPYVTRVRGNVGVHDSCARRLSSPLTLSHEEEDAFEEVSGFIAGCPILNTSQDVNPLRTPNLLSVSSLQLGYYARPRLHTTIYWQSQPQDHGGRSEDGLQRIGRRGED